MEYLIVVDDNGPARCLENVISFYRFFFVVLDFGEKSNY